MVRTSLEELKGETIKEIIRYSNNVLITTEETYVLFEVDDYEIDDNVQLRTSYIHGVAIGQVKDDIIEFMFDNGILSREGAIAEQEREAKNIAENRKQQELTRLRDLVSKYPEVATDILIQEVQKR